MDIIDKLYQHYETLNEAKYGIEKVHLSFHNISPLVYLFTYFLFVQYQKEYQEILGAVKGSEKEKKLASQFIARFAKSFPALENETIDAMFDLCEDNDVLVSQIMCF